MPAETQVNKGKTSAPVDNSSGEEHHPTPEVNGADVTEGVNTDGEEFPVEAKIDFSMFGKRREMQDEETRDTKLNNPKRKENTEESEEESEEGDSDEQESEKDKGTEESEQDNEQDSSEDQTTEEEVEQPPAKKNRSEQLTELGIPVAEHKIYKAMSNEAFNKVKGILQQNKKTSEELAQLKANPPKAASPTIPLYGNPEGYKLDPDYKRTAGAVATATQVLNYYNTQLDKALAGEEWHDLDYDAQSGQLYTVKEASEPNAAALSHLRHQIREAEMHLSKNNQELTQLTTNYKTKHESDIKFIKETENKFFPDYDKPDHPTKKLQEDFIKLLPDSQQSNPLATTLAKTVANNTLLKKMIEERDGKIKAKDIELAKFKGKGKAGNSQQPSKNSFQGKSGTNKGSEITFDMINRRRQGVDIGI